MKLLASALLIAHAAAQCDDKLAELEADLGLCATERDAFESAYNYYEKNLNKCSRKLNNERNTTAMLKEAFDDYKTALNDALKVCKKCHFYGDCLVNDLDMSLSCSCYQWNYYNGEVCVANSIVAADTIGDVGQDASMVLDSQGRPVVSYLDDSSDSLKLMHCYNPGCTQSSIVTVDGEGMVGQFSSLKLSSDGLPRIAYFEGYNNYRLKLALCLDEDCDAADIKVLDNSANVGTHVSMVLDEFDNVVVSYYDNTNKNLKLLRCSDPLCDNFISTKTVDTAYLSGLYTSVKLDDESRPVVSYFDRQWGNLKILRCGDTTCSVDNTIEIPDRDGSVGMYTSLELDGDFYPVVSYFDDTTGSLKLLHCGSRDCSSNNTITVADANGEVGYYTSLVLDKFGAPAVSYLDKTSEKLRVLHCGDPYCSAGNSITMPDLDGDNGYYTSIAIDKVGRPIVAYYSDSSGDLKILYCGNDNCEDDLAAGGDFFI